MFGAAPLSIAIRTYGAIHGAHRHAFAQLVLPLEGSLAIEVGGREAVLSPKLGAFVHPGASHDQESRAPNRSLILDLDPRKLPPGAVDRLASRTFLALSPEANSLINYVGLALGRQDSFAPKARLWMPLLLDALAADQPQPRSRLAALLAALDADPFTDWTAPVMAAKAGLSVSRMHALFREELSTSPVAYVTDLRLKHAQAWLADSPWSIAEIAYRCGYSDQAAFTRALRKATGLTPAAYRRQTQESRPKHRES